MTQQDLIFQCFKLLYENNVCYQTSPHEWLKNLLWMHKKGYLYVNMTKDEIDIVVGAYRIEKYDDNLTDVMPEIESG